MDNKEKKTEEEKHDEHEGSSFVSLPPRLVGLIAEEVAKTVAKRLPGVLSRPRRKKPRKLAPKLENAYFLDTSAIIDGRVFSLVNLGLFSGNFVILESILLELKHIADSQDVVKRERGKRGLTRLDKMKKAKNVKVIVLPETREKLETQGKMQEVDERLIHTAKAYKGKIITCDFNLEKKASITDVTAINVHSVAQALKVTAVPGEALHIKVLHQGKEHTQGVGYLEDGTMIVVEEGIRDIGKTVDVIVSRVISTATGRILFSKKI